MIEKIPQIFLLFLLLCLIIIIYNLIMQIQNNYNAKNINYRYLKMQRYIFKGKYVLLANYLKNIENLKIFNEEIKVKDLTLDLTMIITILIPHYAKKSSIDKAYLAYTIKLWQVRSNQTIAYLNAIINDKSIYCSEMSLEAIYEIGTPEEIFYELLMLSKNKTDYNAKLLTDGMLNYHGNTIKLCTLLINSFNLFSSEMQIGFIKYFKFVNYEPAQEELFALLKSSTNKELNIAIIRYFAKVKVEVVKEYLVKALKDNYYHDYEYNVVIIQTLAFYINNEIINLLINELSNPNYYIRYNSAKVLNKEINIKDLKISDKYGQEIIDYFIAERG
jgi:hypothetical protein